MSGQKEISYKDLILLPFKYGEVDCWEIVREVFKRNGIIIPNYSPARRVVEMANYDLGLVGEAIENSLGSWKRIEKPEIPCAIVMSVELFCFHHLGAYIGKGKFIHARKKTGVTIERLDNPLYANRKFYRYCPQ